MEQLSRLLAWRNGKGENRELALSHSTFIRPTLCSERKTKTALSAKSLSRARPREWGTLTFVRTERAAERVGHPSRKSGPPVEKLSLDIPFYRTRPSVLS